MTEAEARQTLISALTDFERVLGEEYSALLHKDAELLERSVAEKERLTTLINDASRDCDLSSEARAASGDAQSQWRQIETLLQRCELANRKNGAAVKSSKNHVSSLLDVLSGRPPRERLYDARGLTGGGGSSSRPRERV